jgi:hypothetical protein
MFLESGKAYFVAWIGQDWPAPPEIIDRRRLSSLSWTRVRSLGALTNRNRRLAVMETASPERVEAPPTLTS